MAGIDAGRLQPGLHVVVTRGVLAGQIGILKAQRATGSWLVSTSDKGRRWLKPRSFRAADPEELGRADDRRLIEGGPQV